MDRLFFKTSGYETVRELREMSERLIRQSDERDVLVTNRHGKVLVRITDGDIELWNVYYFSQSLAVQAYYRFRYLLDNLRRKAGLTEASNSEALDIFIEIVGEDNGHSNIAFGSEIPDKLNEMYKEDIERKEAKDKDA